MKAVPSEVRKIAYFHKAKKKLWGNHYKPIHNLPRVRSPESRNAFDSDISIWKIHNLYFCSQYVNPPAMFFYTNLHFYTKPQQMHNSALYPNWVSPHYSLKHTDLSPYVYYKGLRNGLSSWIRDARIPDTDRRLNHLTPNFMVDVTKRNAVF